MPRRLPPLPKWVRSPLGRVAVRVVPRTALGHTHDGGNYDASRLEILIAEDLSLRVQWQVLWHERVHLIVDLYGLQLSARDEESVCSAIATEMVAGMLE